jgi:hypothetical protein
MKKWKERLEILAMAIAYAEAGDWESAREFLKRPQQPSKPARKDQKKRQQRRPRIHLYRD